VATVAVHVVDHDVIAASDGYTVILIDDDTGANLGVVCGSEVEAVTVVGSGKAVGAIVGRVSGTVIQRDVIDVQTYAVADAETMYRVVLDVDIVDGARA
jgi:hypothetical protein